LGNPGKEYDKTPHNVGFSLLQQYVAEKSLGKAKSKWRSLAWDHWVGDVKIIVLLPQTYMNLSGEALRLCVKDNDIEIENILVVHDDIDLNLSNFKFKSGGGEAGHKGLKSITASLSTQCYTRMRVGIGPRPINNLSDFVLKRFSNEDNDVILSRFPLMLESIDFWCGRGTVETMNRFNGTDNKKIE